jgi:hypothetical protein
LVQETFPDQPHRGELAGVSGGVLLQDDVDHGSDTAPDVPFDSRSLLAGWRGGRRQRLADDAAADAVPFGQPLDRQVSGLGVLADRREERGFVRVGCDVPLGLDRLCSLLSCQVDQRPFQRVLLTPSDGGEPVGPGAFPVSVVRRPGQEST